MPLRQLFPGEAAPGGAAKVDIIAVHGLNPRSKSDSDHAWDTWRTPDGRLWLRDDLPQHVSDSRIFLYEYNATAVYGKDRDTFIGKANELLEAIRIKRDEDEKRPIIFLCHSMGGLLVKQALINAHMNPKYTAIKASTSGLVFFATPHNGGDWTLVSLGKTASKIATMVGFQRGDDIMEVLKNGSMFSDTMKEHWRHQLREYDIISFWGGLDYVVPKESAQLGMPGDQENVVKLNADHGGVCKFGPNQTDQDNLELVQKNIEDVYRKALKKCDTRRHNSVIDPACQHHNLLPQNKKFTGRETILQELERKLFVEQDCQRLAIVGLGGVGKTQVALQFAYWVKNNCPEYAVLWVPALSEESFDQACTDIAKELNIRSTIDDGDLKDLVRRHLSSKTAGKWLLVVDNADEMELLFRAPGKPSGIYNYLPESEYGIKLFTTRSREVASAVAGTEMVELQEMSSFEGKTFLEKSLVSHDQLQDTALTTELLEKLNYLPLAIAQAAAYMNTKKVSIGQYIELLNSTEQDVVELMSRQLRDTTSDPGPRHAVATTWLVSFEQIRKVDRAAADLLLFISCIEPKGIPQSLLPSSGSALQLVDATGTLCAYSFLTRRGNSKVFDQHSLVHLAARLWAKRKGLTAKTVEEAIRHLATVFPNDNYANRSQWREYLPHALQVLQQSEELNVRQRSELLYRVGQCQLADTRISEAVRYLREGCKWRDSHLAEDHPDRLTSQHALARAYRANGQVKEAIELFEYVVPIRNSNMDEDNPDRLASQHELARAYRADRRFKEAVQLLEYVVATRDSNLAEDHPDRLASQHELARAYRAHRRFKEAIKLLEHVVAVRNSSLAEDHVDRLASQVELARAYKADGQFRKATRQLEHVVAVRNNSLAEDHPARLESQCALARACRGDNQTEEADKLLKHVFKHALDGLARDHPCQLALQHAHADVDQANRKVSTPSLRSTEHLIRLLRDQRSSQGGR